MLESKLLGTLLPSLPDFIPILHAIREKYNLPEISPDDDPITEIYLGNEIVPLEEFRNDIESLILENLSFLPPKLFNIYLSVKDVSKTQYNTQIKEELSLVPDDIKKAMDEITKFLEIIMNLVFQIIDPMISKVVDILYIFLLTGESEEMPNDWISKFTTVTVFGETMIMAMVSQFANPDVIVQQFREEYNITFGAYHPKITNTATSTAYILRLKKMGKPWDYIVEEYIRLNKFKLPKDRTSKRFSEDWRRYGQRLKKRIQRTESVLEILVRDIK
jgi:hypothetical protein